MQHSASALLITLMWACTVLVYKILKLAILEGLHGIAGKRVVINMAGTGVPKLNLASIGVVTNAANK
jgi:hypothetical protein